MRGCVLGNTTDCPIYLESLMSGAAADILRKRKETKYSENNTLISIEGDNSSGLLVKASIFFMYAGVRTLESWDQAWISINYALYIRINLFSL